jgi:hypothetical protein
MIILTFVKVGRLKRDGAVVIRTDQLRSAGMRVGSNAKQEGRRKREKFQY